MGGYLASREVLTAADRRQINYASGRYSADMCISRSHPSDGIPVMDVRASLLVLRFGRPLPCVLSGEGFLLRSRACTGLLFANTPTYISYPFYQRTVGALGVQVVFCGASPTPRTCATAFRRPADASVCSRSDRSGGNSRCYHYTGQQTPAKAGVRFHLGQHDQWRLGWSAWSISRVLPVVYWPQPGGAGPKLYDQSTCKAGWNRDLGRVCEPSRARLLLPLLS